MTIQVVLGALGALLLLTAVLGGGFELRELKVPQVGRVARGVAGLLGAVCVLFAIGLAELDDAAHANRGSSPTQPPSHDRPVHVALTDELGEGQVSEQVSVVFDGRNVGDLKVDADYPTAQLEITLPQAGRYDYTLASDTQELADDGRQNEITGSGTGSVLVADGDQFDVEMADNGLARDVTLVHR
jgi:hypothetical protein